MSNIKVEFGENNPVNVNFKENNPINIKMGNIVDGTVLPQDYVNKINVLLNAFDVARNSAYTEFVFSGDDISQINIWEDNTKVLKLFTKDFVFVSGEIQSITITDEVNSKSLTKTFTFNNGKIESKTEVYT